MLEVRIRVPEVVGALRTAEDGTAGIRANVSTTRLEACQE